MLFAMDTVDRLDSFYLYNEDGSGLRQARGYFVYYDRNREMQEYMLDNSMIRPREETAEIETEAEQPKEGSKTAEEAHAGGADGCGKGDSQGAAKARNGGEAGKKGA